MRMKSADGLGTSNVRRSGMDRDLGRVMIGTVLHALVLASALACQQGEKKEAAGEVAVTLPMRPAPVPTPDADVQAAQVELAEGRASAATRIVMPVLRSPGRRTPEAVLVAARAAAEWGGWPLVSAMLAYEPWLDTKFSGEGLELLARSALERGEAAEARNHAEAALRVPSTPSSRALRLVLLARALDRLDLRDSAAGTYRRAADALPIAREWLLLRAAGSTADAKARERMYATIRGAAARARIPYTEAQALERFRKELASADAYEKLGDMPSAYRLRLASDNDASSRSLLRAGLLGYLQRDARGDDLQRGLEVLDAAFPRLDATSQLVAARRAAEGGVPSRAVAGFKKAPPGLITDADVLSWARALIATGRPSEAAARLATRRFGAAAASEGLYLRGLAFLRAGKTSAARPVFNRVVTAYPASREAADALYLVADLESDAGRDARARNLHQQSCVHKPAGSYSDEACFRAGILSFALGDARRAATTFDELPERFPSSSEATAATYWAGRAWERARNDSLARERWNAVVASDPLSFYASPSARRRGTILSLPTASAIPVSPHFQSAVARAAVLEALGMDTEEKYEYEGIEDEAAASPGMALGAGAALLERGEVTRAIKLGWKAIGAARTSRDSIAHADQRGFALVYPVLRDSELVARARANKLDPALVAAVIRQESSWNPGVVSRAGARGLMQLMPPVGQDIARSRRYSFWDPALLFDASVSLELGTSHLRAALQEYSSLPRALAAYNAGGSRVRRWVRRRGASDPELFIERIPFTETRDYVRIVMHNAEMYRALYGLTK